MTPQRNKKQHTQRNATQHNVMPGCSVNAS